MPEKCSGIYDCSKVRESWLTEDLPASFKISHSRLNGLAKARSGPEATSAVGVERRRRRHLRQEQPSQFIFFQGHPEYEALTLQREYVRDVRRYLAGEQEIYPCIPAGYFDAATTAALEAFRRGALIGRDPALIDNFPKLVVQPNVLTEPSVAAAVMFRNWVGYLAERKRYLASDVPVLEPRRAVAGLPGN